MEADPPISVGGNFSPSSKSLGYACSWAERAPVALEKALRQKSQEKQDRPLRWDAVSTQELSSTALAEIRGSLTECVRSTESICYARKLPKRWFLCILLSPPQGLPNGYIHVGCEQGFKAQLMRSPATQQQKLLHPLTPIVHFLYLYLVLSSLLPFSDMYFSGFFWLQVRKS